MSHEEALGWAAYMRKRGSLNLGSRMEFGFAGISALIINRTGGRSRVEDFMPHLREDIDDDGEATLQDVMGILMGARRNG